MSDIHERGAAQSPSQPETPPVPATPEARPGLAGAETAPGPGAPAVPAGAAPGPGGPAVPAGAAPGPRAAAVPPGAAPGPGGPAVPAGPAPGPGALAVPAGAAPPHEPWPPFAMPRRPAAVTWRDAAVGLAIALVVAALGAPLALLWAGIGPHAEIVMLEGGPILEDYNTEAFVGGDVTFGAIAVGMGVVVGLGAWLLRWWRGPAVVVALAVGSIAGAWITWKLGERIGLAEYRELLRTAEAGDKFYQPMKLRAQGLLFLQATIAVIGYVVNAAWSHRPDLGAEHRYPDAPISPGGYPLVSSDPSAPAAPPAAPAPPGASTASSPPA